MLEFEKTQFADRMGQDVAQGHCVVFKQWLDFVLVEVFIAEVLAKFLSEPFHELTRADMSTSIDRHVRIHHFFYLLSCIQIDFTEVVLDYYLGQIRDTEDVLIDLDSFQSEVISAERVCLVTVVRLNYAFLLGVGIFVFQFLLDCKTLFRCEENISHSFDFVELCECLQDEELAEEDSTVEFWLFFDDADETLLV